MTDAFGDIHGGKLREAAAALGLEATAMLDFSANVNFLGPTPDVMAAARRAVDEMAWYPLDPPAPLRRAAAAFLDVPEDQVILGNGASELIFLLMAHLRPRQVLIIGPTFTEYERAARAWGAEVDVLWLPEAEDFRLSFRLLDRADVRARIQKADLVFVCDPNNPTGSSLDREVRDSLLDAAAEAGTVVFVDESFLAFTAEWPTGSATHSAGWGGAKDPGATGPGTDTHLVVLHSFTKILAMPGLRVGALVVSPERAAEIAPRTPPWNINCVAQAAAMTAFVDPHLAPAAPAATAEARATLADGLASLRSVECVLPADANFLCVRLTSPAAGDIAVRLRDQHGVLVRDLSSFPGMGPRYLRVAVRASDDNHRLLTAWRTAAGSEEEAEVCVGTGKTAGSAVGRGML